MKTADRSIFRRRTESRRDLPQPEAPRRWTPRIAITGSHWQIALGLMAVILAVYAYGLWYPGFGPELAMFFKINSQRPLSEILHTYGELQHMWYRPSALHLPYWLGGQLFDWGNVVAWKLFQLSLLAAACWMQYLFTLEFLGRWKLAAWFAAVYLAVFPGQASIVLQTSAFDNSHLIFSLLTALLFSRAIKSSGRSMWLFNAASCLCYAIALTCKESTMILPLFLVAIALLRGRRDVWPTLVPHFALLGAYLFFHVLPMPSRGSEDAYRTGFNFGFIVRNLWSYPLWIVHVFGGTAHPSQTQGHNTIVNNIAGIAILAASVRYWAREQTKRVTLKLMLAWIVITSLIPVYSGAYLWHVNLAVCGYAVLAGAGLANLASETAAKWRHGRSLSATATTAVLIALGVYAVHNTLTAGVHSLQYRLSAGLQQDASKLPATIASDTLVYVEDRMKLGAWSYGGGGNLMKFHFRNPRLEEKLVPALNEVPWDLRYEWLRRPNALFVRYDDQMRWFDASREFRSASIARLTEYTSKLIEEGKWLHLIALLEACFREREARENPLLQYHYGFALHNCNRTYDAIAAYGKSLDLQPSFYFTLLNRGNAFRQVGSLAMACSDYRRAAGAPGALPHVTDLIKQYCK